MIIVKYRHFRGLIMSKNIVKKNHLAIIRQIYRYHTTECVLTKFKKCTRFCINASESMMYNVAFGNNL